MCTSCVPFDLSDYASTTEGMSANTDNSIENGYLYDKTVLFETFAVLDGSRTTTAYVISDKDLASNYWVDVYLYANISKKDILHKIGNFESHSVTNGKLLAFDINGDLSDELILNTEITGNGGTVSCVYEYTEDGFKEICNFDNYIPQFECENISNSRVNVSSSQPAFSYNVPLNDIFGDRISSISFDSDGVAQHTFYAFTDHIYDIALKDGKIVCTMPLEIEMTYCFDVRQYFDYDTVLHAFVVTEYEFVEINSAR